MKQTYKPTLADYLTGQKLTDLRRRAGETLRQTVDRSGVDFNVSTLSRIERGERWLSNAEAAKLAAHFDTSTDKIIVHPASALATLAAAPDAPPLVIPEPIPDPAPAALPVLVATAESADTLIIDRDNPMHPDDYRLSVWLPYLEARYNEDERKTA